LPAIFWGILMIDKNENLIVWRRTQTALHLAARCVHCDGVGSILSHTFERIDCVPCNGRGWFGIDPQSAASVDPGSVEKVAVLGVRYASGAPLWDRRDRCASETLAAEELAPNQAKACRRQNKRKGRKRAPERDKSPADQTKATNRQTTSLAP
jgi:hypothetical protein